MKREPGNRDLRYNGNSITDPREIKMAIQNFYQNPYKEPEMWRPEFQLHNSPIISNEEQI
ncbi:hypothetical protein H5410_050119 [Solanum commersonii]|uniref:Uncharacterized protein n=1 Tax=Solanum commersonii TaxID=4109 RepID=A0A9J5WWN8_SOLCO|nr:hypothetical protein H5410_050119 [Solanum commersonii]